MDPRTRVTATPAAARAENRQVYHPCRRDTKAARLRRFVAEKHHLYKASWRLFDKNGIPVRFFLTGRFLQPRVLMPDESLPNLGVVLSSGREWSAMKAIVAFLRDESGPTAVEYAVLLAGIILTALAAIAALGQQTGVMYNDIDGEMKAHGIQ
jgi:pilus assembly protein Flp/PilA